MIPMTMLMIVELFPGEITAGTDVDVIVMVDCCVTVENIKTVVEVGVISGDGVVVAVGMNVGWGIPIFTSNFSPG